MILPKRSRWRPKSKDILLSEKEAAARESYEYKYDDIIKEISIKDPLAETQKCLM